MRTVEEVRKIRLAELTKEFGTVAALNELRGKTRIDSTLSQYLNESSTASNPKPKVMGSAVARELEVVCKKPLGWMDTDPDLQHGWPLPEDLREAIQRLPKEKLTALEALIRSSLQMVSATIPTEATEAPEPRPISTAATHSQTKAIARLVTHISRLPEDEKRQRLAEMVRIAHAPPGRGHRSSGTKSPTTAAPKRHR